MLHHYTKCRQLFVAIGIYLWLWSAAGEREGAKVVTRERPVIRGGPPMGGGYNGGRGGGGGPPFQGGGRGGPPPPFRQFQPPPMHQQQQQFYPPMQQQQQQFYPPPRQQQQQLYPQPGGGGGDVSFHVNNVIDGRAARGAPIKDVSVHGSFKKPAAVLKQQTTRQAVRISTLSERNPQWQHFQAGKMPNGETAVNSNGLPDTHLLPVNIFNLSFFVSAKHHKWVLKNERGCLAAVDRTLSSRKNNCTTFDIGMNDGFYTQLFGAYGCQTWSFELHPKCISISQMALERNGLSNLVNISHAAVSDTNKRVSVPKSPNCDGSLSISRQFSQVVLLDLEYPIYPPSHMITGHCSYPVNLADSR